MSQLGINMSGYNYYDDNDYITTQTPRDRFNYKVLTRRADSSLVPVLLHSAEGYSYYKVPVAEGVRLVEGAVADTCEEAGMRAVCLGDTDCPYTDTTKCDVTRLSSDCEFPM